eukprot:3650045-Amphidinium_carterae.1
MPSGLLQSDQCPVPYFPRLKPIQTRPWEGVGMNITSCPLELLHRRFNEHAVTTGGVWQSTCSTSSVG